MPMADLSPVTLIEGSYAIEADDGAIYLPIIGVENPGHGEGGRFLDSLPTDRTIKVPGVINLILAGMLKRRGFVREWEFAEEFDVDVEVWVRTAVHDTTRIGP